MATSACEAEHIALFETGKAVVSMRNIAEALGLPQEVMPVACDNQAATAIANDTAREERNRNLRIRLNWGKDKVYQHMLHVKWRPGDSNLADFFIKLLERKEFEEKRNQVVVECN